MILPVRQRPVDDESKPRASGDDPADIMMADIDMT